MATTLADRSPLPRRLTTRRKKRRGLVLLMVVSLLALFLLMGVTFAILAIQYKTAATVQAQVGVYGDPPMQEMDAVFNQVLFDTQGVTSLTQQSMLRDLYGNDYVMCPVDATSVTTTSPDEFPNFGNGTITYAHETVGNVGTSQFVRITFNANQTYSPTSGPARTISPIPGYYNGRVLTTYVAQVNQWISARIVHYIPSNILIIEQLVSTSGAAVLPDANAPFIINGLPFNGTGNGYDSTSNALTAVDPASGPGSGGLTALLPHVSNYSDLTARFRIGLGGADESYDVADYQNMFLAFVPSQSLNTNFPLIPSLHRPELLNFWRRNVSSLTGGTITSLNPSTDDGKRLLRQIIFRPMPWDHPNFTGSNTNFSSGVSHSTMLDHLSQQSGGGWTRVWDVDNDGDGLPDSIWFDPGLPVMTSPTGRRYKRLAAILVKDLDGRVNINVSGNSSFAADEDARSRQDFTPASSPRPPLTGLQANTPTRLIRGLGYGPSEIDFCNIFGGYPGGQDAQNPQYSGVLLQRYGNDGVPGATGDDNFSRTKTLGMVDNHGTTTSIYSTPPDVWGRGAVAMDYAGRPAWINIGHSETNEDPYEMQFDPQTAVDDSPYNAGDMERLLRNHDHDVAQLPDRLIRAAGGNPANLPGTPIGGALASSFAGTIGADHYARESITTMSSHIPVPRTFWRNDGRLPAIGHPSASVLDLYYQRLSGVANFNQEWQKIVPWDFQHGEMFNLNRIFGNNVDDNGNTLIDEPGEATASEAAGGTTIEHLNDTPGLTSTDPRQLYARHLYCLMMLLKPTGMQVNGSSQPQDIARFFAQYAVNIVDFRDNDSISTGFEYDINPFDGWGVDGNLSDTTDLGQRAVVWGVERPELLITEAIAFHDRRTEDSDMSTEAGLGKTTDVGPRMDLSFDQRLRPKGRFFFELFNPWVDRTGGSMDKVPAELYLGSQGVKLDATAPNGHPVWRVIVLKSQPYLNGRDPDFPSPDSPGAADFDRSIYFTDPVGLTTMRPGESAQNRFFPSEPIAPVMPGRYAVAGSSGLATPGNGGNPPTYTSHIGRTQAGANDAALTAAELGNTRRIVIRPSTSTTTNQFTIESNSGTQMDLNTLNPVVGIAISQPTSLSLTEPLGGYTGAGWDNGIAPVLDEPNGTGSYVPPHGEPLDKNRADWADKLLSDRTYPNERVLCLQRLANPTQQWHPLSNPYLTIDTSSVDVTAFNGLTNDPDRNNGGSKNTDIAFVSFERGGSPGTPPYFTPPPGPARPTRLLWKVEPNHGVPSSASPNEGAGLGPHIFNKVLLCTLGYLNQGYGQPFTNVSGVPSVYVGAPTATANPGEVAFPWLNFNNRPFMSPAELLQVPVTSQSQLLVRFSIVNGAAPADVYDNNQEPDQLFGHLPNFMRTNQTIGTVAGSDGPMMARLLDYLETPSRFVRTERYYTPDQFSTTAAPGNNAATGYRPPFNHLSRFRDPGRINLNTFGDERIWQALIGEYQQAPGSPSAAPLPGWPAVAAISQSRQGYAGAPGQMVDRYPSIFANPFRATEAADLMPNIASVADLRRREADAALFRRREGVNDPLLAADIVAGSPHVDPTRGSFFRYLPLQKVANNVTTNSNCFAVWVTVGYFEVEDVTTPYNANDPRQYPDGFMLGQELGLDLGNTQRHRAFYILDRSIPVGFIPGLKLNTDNCVLLKRQID